MPQKIAKAEKNGWKTDMEVPLCDDDDDVPVPTTHIVARAKTPSQADSTAKSEAKAGWCAAECGMLDVGRWMLDVEPESKVRAKVRGWAESQLSASSIVRLYAVCSLPFAVWRGMRNKTLVNRQRRLWTASIGGTRSCQLWVRPTTIRYPRRLIYSYIPSSSQSSIK